MSIRVSHYSSLIVMALLSGVPVLGTAAEAIHFSLPAQSLADALRAVGTLANTSLVFDPALVDGRHAPALEGEATLDEALRKLLSGTGITHQFLNEKTVILAGERSRDGKVSEVGAAQREELVRIAQGEPAVGDANAPQSQPMSEDEKLEEITVTAQKREQRLLDVPVPVTAISGETLVDRHQLRFQDYFSNFPGLNFGSGSRDDTFPAIRGLTTGTYTNPTVGTVLDDMPYGASIGSVPAPDIDPSDLERIEVLRGPQGTLYGASSLGGLIKYVTVDPSVEGFAGRVEAGMSSVKNGDDLGYIARAAVNVPIAETLAVRASGFMRSDPGYIDNPVRGIEGLNERDAAGGHLAALWKPSDDFSLKLSALLQRSDADGNSFFFVNPGFGDLQQNYLPGATGYKRRDETLGATVKARLGSVDLTSISSYSDYDHVAEADISVVFGALAQRAFGANVSGTYFADTLTVHKFAQEIRLTSSFGSRLDWLLGGFYTKESLGHPTDYFAVDPVTLETLFFGHSDAALRYREHAVFADLTLHVTERFDLQIGGRQSSIEQPKSVQTTVGDLAIQRFNGVNPFIVNVGAADAHPFTYLFTPQFKFTPDLMMYLRLASGFQPGGVNLGAGVPPTYDPNTTENYELGLKGNLPGRAVSFDVSLYRINWKDLPTVFVLNNTTFRINGGEARSEGVELSVEARPLSGLTISGWVAWSDAELVEAVSPGAVGDKLPYSTRWSGNLSVDQRFPLTPAVNGFAGVVWSYMGDRLGNLGAIRQEFPSYSNVDLRLGVDFDSWKVNAFVNNVADKRGAIGGGRDAAFPPFPLLYIQPRTVGFSLSKTFQ